MTGVKVGMPSCSATRTPNRKDDEMTSTREQLLARVWGHDVSVGARTVDVHVRRLRGLLESAGYDRQLQTVRGSGYRYSLTV